MRSACAFGIEHGYVPEEILWGKAEGRTPLNDHPDQSAGLVVLNFFPGPCEAVPWEVQAGSGVREQPINTFHKRGL
jgi:hypothetical protein